MRRILAKVSVVTLLLVGAAGTWSPAEAHECWEGEPGTPSCIPDTTH